METHNVTVDRRVPWNKDKITGQKTTRKLRAIGDTSNETLNGVEYPGTRDVRLSVDRKLRACDLARLQESDIRHGSHVATISSFRHNSKFRSKPVRVLNHGSAREQRAADSLFPSKVHTSPYLLTRQIAGVVHHLVASIGLDDIGYGMHTLRRTTASLIYPRPENLRAVQPLRHAKLESIVRHLAIEVDDALEKAELV